MKIHLHNTPFLCVKLYFRYIIKKTLKQSTSVLIENVTLEKTYF